MNPPIPRSQAEQELRQLTEDLQERVKELNCLYSVSSLTQQVDLPSPDLYRGVLNSLVAAYRFPDAACARLRLNGEEFRSEAFEETKWRQAARVRLDGDEAGTLEVFYRDRCPAAAEGPFLAQERSLIEAVATLLGRSLQERRTRSALEASEARYRNLFENMADGYSLHEILLDKAGRPCDYRFLEVNAAFERILGLRRADVIGKRILELAPDTERYWIETYGRVALTGEPVRFERYAVAFDRYFEVSASSPQRGLFAAIFSDTTPRRRMEEAIRASETALREAQRIARLGSWELDPDWNESRWSEEMFRIFGWPVQAGPIPFQRVLEAVHPDDRERLKASLEGCLKHPGPYELEHRIVRPDGEVRWIQTRGEGVTGTNSEVIGFMGTALDITDRKRAEDEAVRLGRQNQSILDAAGEGIYGLDATGRCTFANPAALAMLGLTSEALIGQESHALFHHSREDGSPYPVEECPVHNVLRQRSVYRGAEETFWKVDGSSFPVECVSNPMWEGDRLVGAVVSFLDISERKRRESALYRANAELEETLNELRATQRQVIQSEKLSALGTLAAGMAHELNNPLMGVMGYVDIARSRTKEPEAQHLLSDASLELRRMRDLLKNTLAFARPIAEVLSAVSIVTVVERALALVRPDFKTRGITVDVRFSDDLPPVPATEGHLQQVFVNLLMNARDAVEAVPSKRIRVDAFCSDGWLVVEISDNGKGIPQRLQGRIFDPFFTTKPPGQGTGLGLSISQNIVTELGGRLTCRSREGEGTTFSVALPIVEGRS